MGKTTSNRWCLALRRTCLAPAAAAHPQTSANGVPDRNRSTTSYMKNHKRDFHFYGVEREGKGGERGVIAGSQFLSSLRGMKVQLIEHDFYLCYLMYVRD